MKVILPGQANLVSHNLVKIADSQPLTTGTVAFYLLAVTGTNAGKWWNASGASWSDSKVSAGAGTNKDGALWLCTIAAGAWSYGVFYELYAMDSEDLSIFYTEQVVPSCVIGTVGSGDVIWPYTVTNSLTSNPIEGVTVLVTSDAAGQNRVARGTTDANGQVTFYLTAGTYYFWRLKAGYSFDDAGDPNPDMEVVS